jgi:DNA-binding NtrC family response regulator
VRRHPDPMTGAEDWGRQLALDIHVAARTSVPVLISAPITCGENVARAIAAFASAWSPPELVVCDCTGGGNLADAMASARAHVADPEKITLLLREVHALGFPEQAEVARIVAAPGEGRAAGAPRILSTSSVSLFDRVRQGTFDERLFYRLNVMHIVVKAMGDLVPPGAA